MGILTKVLDWHFKIYGRPPWYDGRKKYEICASIQNGAKFNVLGSFFQKRDPEKYAFFTYFNFQVQF